MLQNIAAAAVNRVLQGPLDHHIDIEGADGPHTLYTAAGSLMSMFELRGCRRSMDQEELSEAVMQLREGLAGWLDTPGHALQLVYFRDPLAARGAVDAASRAIRRQAEDLKLDLADMIEDRSAKLAAAGAWERILVTVHTHPAAIPAGERRRAGERISESMKGLPPMRDAQVPLRVAETVRLVHAAVVEALPGNFAAAGQELTLLTASEAAQAIAWALDPAVPGDGFAPRLGGLPAEGDPARFRRSADSAAQQAGHDYSSCGAERLSWQLLRSHARIEDGRAVRIGDSLMRGFDMALAPETLVPFQRLLEQTLDRDEPVRWRASFLIEAGGWSGTAFKRMFTTVFAFLAKTQNDRIRNAFQDLRQIDGAEDTVVRFRCAAACWDDAGQPDRLRRSAARLRQAFQRWSNARVDELAGDPVACLMGSLPGAGCAPTGPAATAPLSDALALLPLDRPCSPWSSGPMTLIAEAGSLWPYRPGSPVQDSWCDLISGQPGSGKSVLLNAFNLAALLSGAGRDEPLPLVGVIDIGPSSSGLVSLIASALPPEQRGLALAARLQNAPEWAVNIFDTPVGCRRPTVMGRSFAVNFVRLLLSAAAGGDELGGLIGQAVDQAYLTASDSQRPKRWHDGHGDLDRALEETGWSPDSAATWWECVDHLSDAGRWREAALAQRLAVPLLPELAQAAAEPRIAEVYKDMRLGTGEPALEGLQRVLAEAAAEWPVLTSPTVFAMTSARLRVIDLQDVTAPSAAAGAQRGAALMYMLARHICTDGYYLAEDEVPTLQLRPSQSERLADAARHARRTPKRLSMDEFHRCGSLDGIVDQVQTDVREGRKHNVQIALASQYLNDFPERVLGMATGVWICRAGIADAELADRTLGIGESGRYALRHRLTGPGTDGAPVYACLTAHGGDVRQLLTHKASPSEIWAWSTTAEDVALRDELGALLGPAEARRTLAAAWPSGSARGEILRRRELASLRGESGQVISQMAEDLARVRRAA